MSEIVCEDDGDGDHAHEGFEGQEDTAQRTATPFGVRFTRSNLCVHAARLFAVLFALDQRLFGATIFMAFVVDKHLVLVIIVLFRSGNS